MPFGPIHIPEIFVVSILAKNVAMEEKKSLPSWTESLQVFQQVWEQGMDNTQLWQTQLLSSY